MPYDFHDVLIEDPALIEFGFTKFSLPLNGGTQLIIKNIDHAKVVYCPFHKHDSIDKLLKSLEYKLSIDDAIDDETARSLVAYIRNELIQIEEDDDLPFFKFKNGNSNGGNGNGDGDGKANNKSKPKQKPKSRSEIELERQQQQEKEDEERIAVIRKNISSFEEWQTTLSQKYKNLYNTVQKLMPNLWQSLEFDLSIKNILCIKDCTLPFAGIVLGKPSSMKTVGIEMFRKSRHTFYTDKFSSKSFVSHSTGVPPEQLELIDLLPKIRNKCFLTPELAPTFAAKDDDLIETLGILTRVLDGHGYESDSGAHGHRGYNEHMMFTWIGAAVDIPFKVHKLLTTLGPKLYFLRVSKTDYKSDDSYFSQLQDNDFDTKINQIQQALADYQDYFEACPAMVHDDRFNSSIKKIPWLNGNAKDDEITKLQLQKEAYMHIIKLGKLLAYLRGVVPTWHTQDTQGAEYGYGIPTIEEPDRAMQQLANLAKGHALLTGRNYVSLEDLPLIVRVVLSTAPMERITIFDILLANNGILTVNQITEFLNVSEPTARRTMTELKALGLVNMQKADAVCEDGIVRNRLIMTLKEEFNWFLSDEFKTLREDFVPASTGTQEDSDSIGIDTEEKQQSNRTIYNDMKEKSPPPLPITNNNNSYTDTSNSSSSSNRV